MMVMLYCAHKQFYRRPKENLHIKVEVDTERLLCPPCPLMQFPWSFQGTNLALYAINKATLVSHGIFCKAQIVVVNSKSGPRMRREGRRFRHACRVWSCVLRLCVLERIFLQLKTCLILPPLLLYLAIIIRSQRVALDRRESEQTPALIWALKYRVQPYLLAPHHRCLCSTQAANR